VEEQVARDDGECRELRREHRRDGESMPRAEGEGVEAEHLADPADDRVRQCAAHDVPAAQHEQREREHQHAAETRRQRRPGDAE
jgi:hypothetical protein